MLGKSLINVFSLTTIIDGQMRVVVTVHVGRELFAGQLNVTELDCPIAQIETIFVLEDQRRIGLCKRMMDRAADIAAECGCHSIGLSVLKTNTGAIAAYEKLGFNRIGERDGKFLYVREV